MPNARRSKSAKFQAQNIQKFDLGCSVLDVFSSLPLKHGTLRVRLG
jgi:hypothetical protein